MQVIDLNGQWSLTQRKGDLAVDATVPGDVVGALLEAGKIEAPYYRENENALPWIGNTDWVYARTFDVDPSMLERDCTVLQSDGLDTFAEVRLNGKLVAKTANMHRRYEWDVKRLLKPGRNEIAVAFKSVNAYTRKCFKEHPIRSRVAEGAKNAYPAFVRKEQCNFGWDWGPVLITHGIWRSIRLLAFSTARVGDVSVEQNHRKGLVALKVACELEAIGRPRLAVRASLSRKKSVVAEAEVETRGKRPVLDLQVKQPDLWWPNGMGDPALYDLKLELVTPENDVLDRIHKRVGLRTLTLDRHSDQWGESFQFVVNGVPFFAKGANWIPADAMPSRRKPPLYRRLLKDAAAANMNMIRVWGGGVYEDDCFYDTCDELGLCVWQDFLFACMAYPSWDASFMENVEAEAIDNVRRLRHHACLALWCGNNEMEQQAVGRPVKLGGSVSWETYGLLFDKLLARIVKKNDPHTDYWPSSPHSPLGNRADYNNPTCGDAHLWGVWHGKNPFEWYRTCEHRFNSEFGFQSFPEPKTVYGYTEEGDRNVTSPVMEHHQRSGIGNTTIMQYMLDWFRLPHSFEMTLWVSQILQGMAIKYACEHWRRSMPRGMGTLYWQLNDVWPVASWSSIDYHGRWKALHYMARHFFAPLLISGLEDRETGTVELHVTSDRLKSEQAAVRWYVTDAGGEVLERGDKAIRTPVNGNRKVSTLKLKKLLNAQGDRDLMVWLELVVGKRVVSSNMVTFARPKQLALRKDPGISTSVKALKENRFSITLESAHPALWCWLSFEGIDVRLSDNFVHLGYGKALSIEGKPGRKVTLIALRKALKVYSLVDTYG